MPWRWIEISPAPIPLLEGVRSLSVARKKRRLTSRGLASVRAIQWPHLDDARGLCEKPAWRLGPSGGVVPTSDRGESNHPAVWFHLAAALARLNRLDEAHSAVKAGLALAPTFSVSRARVNWTAPSDDPTYLAQLEPLLTACVKRGCQNDRRPSRRARCDPRRRGGAPGRIQSVSQLIP